MGAAYSQGSFSPSIRDLVGLPLDRVHMRRVAFLKLCQDDMDDHEGFFMTRPQFARVFGVKTDASFVQFAVFDPQRRGVITASDVFGAMALVSDSKIDARLRFVGQLFDTNKDNRLNASDLIMALYSSTRGVAHIKRAIPPPLAILQRLVEECFNQPDADIDDQQQIRIEDVLVFLQTHELTIPYFSHLMSALGAAGDSSDLFKIETRLLKELAELDHQLALVEDREGKEDKELYFRERGGDAQDSTVVGIPGLEEVKVLQEINARQAERERDKSRRPSVVAAEVRKVQEAEATKAMEEQIRRRTVRAQERHQDQQRNAQIRIDHQGPQEAKCFGKDYRRAEDVTQRSMAGELSMLELQMAHKWDSLPQTTYGSIRLDIDLVLDLVEAMGATLTDQQAQEAVDSCKKDQLEATSLQEFLELWRSMNRAKEKPKEKWRERVEVFNEGCNSVLRAVDKLKTAVVERLQRIEEEKDHEAALRQDEREPSLTPQEEGKQGLEEAEEKKENGDESGKPGKSSGGVTALPPGKVTMSVNIGHFSEGRASFALEVVGTGEPTGRSRTVTGQGNNIFYRPDALAKEVIGEEYEDRIKRVSRTQAKDIKLMGTALWFDLVLKQCVVQAQADKLAEQILEAFNNIPQDYSHRFFTCCRVRPLVVGPKSPKSILRVEFLSEKDILSEVEGQLPFDMPLSSAIKGATLKFELGLDLDDLLTLTSQYEDYEKKCYGPQEEELGEKEMNPFVFNKRVKERREVALKAAEATKSMDLPTLKQHLVERGLNTTGTWGEMRIRARQAFLRQADHIGFGELSAFGDSLTKQIFKRFDGDKDSALNFREMTSLLRQLNQPSLKNQEEYLAAARDSECAINDRGDLTVEGLVAYYETYGTLVEDAARLRIGSLDDYVTATVSLAADIIPEAIAQVETIFEGNRWLQWRHKVAAFMTRFTRDLYMDYEVGRLSDLFPPTAIPAAISQPAWLALKVREWQKNLADGWVGAVPELRRAVRDHFGEGTDLVTEIKYQELVPAASGAADDTTIASAMTGGSDTIKTRSIWGDDDEERPINPPSLCPVGTLETLQQLHRQIDLLRGALSKNPGLNARKEYEQQLEATIKEMEDKSRDMEYSVMASLAHIVRSYDGIRDLVDEVSYIGIGNSRVTARLHFTNINFLHLLPEGRGELHPHTARLREKEARVRARKKMAVEMYDVWNARKQATAAAATRAGGAAATGVKSGGGFSGSSFVDPNFAAPRSSLDARKQDPLYIEKNLYFKGLAAKERGEENEADRILAQELWSELVKLRSKRCKDTDGEAVAVNNLAVLLWEDAGEDLNRQEQALALMQKAVDIMQVYAFYLTNAIVREDPVVHQLIKEQVAAESAGAIPPAAAPLGIPQPAAMGYVIMLSNMLYMHDNQSQQPDDVEYQGRLALQERLSGIYRNSCSDTDRDKLADTSQNVDLQGLPALCLTLERPPLEYITQGPEDEDKARAAVAVTRAESQKEKERRRKLCLGVTDLEVLARIDPKKAARMRARQIRRDAMLTRKEEARRKRERYQKMEEGAFRVKFKQVRRKEEDQDDQGGGTLDRVLKVTRDALDRTHDYFSQTLALTTTSNLTRASSGGGLSANLPPSQIEVDQSTAPSPLNQPPTTT